MSETMKKEFQGENLKKESSPKVIGFVYLLLGILVFCIGLMVHYVETGGLPNSDVVSVLIAQLHIKFATDFFVGFFCSLFIVLGIIYLRRES